MIRSGPQPHCIPQPTRGRRETWVFSLVGSVCGCLDCDLYFRIPWNQSVGGWGITMNANPFWSGRERSIQGDGHRDGASPQGPADHQQFPGQGEPNHDVVRVTAADVQLHSNLQPPTARTFDELEIPAAFRQAIENELTSDEQL